MGKKLTVPFFKQEKEYTCGPASLRMVLAFLGDTKDENYLVEAMGVSETSGTPNDSFVSAVKKEGFSVLVKESSTMAEIQECIDRGMPAIVNFIDTNEDEGHFAVVIGYSDTHIILNDPWNGADYSLLISDFVSVWRSKYEPRVGWMIALIPDPYCWLEDGKDVRVQNWITEQNNRAFAELGGRTFSYFKEELEKNFKITSFSSPIPVNGKYFYMERKPDDEQMALYMKEGIDGDAIALVNPNGMKDGGTVTLDYFDVSHSGRYVAYGLSEKGNEMATLFILDTKSRKLLPETIPHCRYSSVVWMPDDSGFFYTRNPWPGTVPKNEEHMYVKVFSHTLGADPKNDPLIFGEGRPKEDMIHLSLSLDGRYLGISVTQEWTRNEIYLYDTTSKETKLLTGGIPAKFGIVLLSEKAFLYTNYKANNYRVLTVPISDLYKPIDEWTEFVSETVDLLEEFRVTQDAFLLAYLQNVSSLVLVLDHDGKEKERLPFPEYSSLTGITARRTESEFFYGVQSFTFPKITYRYDPIAGTYAVHRKTENPIDPEQYVVKQEWFVSKDGTRVPMFVVHKKEFVLDGTHPAILTGYGGFAHLSTPSFRRYWAPWLEKGGVFASANIRGNGDFGEKWHENGMRSHKQNSFDDFIAGAEHLISQKYTSSSRLGIVGGSNGGLLVSAVEMQKPELFGAVCSEVPLTDMVRFPQFGIAARWVHEYGDPNNSEDLRRILSWSPYHNVKKDGAYPPTLFMTAEQDTRVDPLHARKMAAFLQATPNGEKTFIITEIDAGHGPGKPVSKMVESQAYILSFFAKYLGMSF